MDVRYRQVSVHTDKDGRRHISCARRLPTEQWLWRTTVQAPTDPLTARTPEPLITYGTAKDSTPFANEEEAIANMHTPQAPRP